MGAQDWRIEVLRTGGYAGIGKRAAVARADLTDEDANRLQALVERARDRPTDPSPDAFQYDITITGGFGRAHVRVGEAELERDQRSLLKRLLASTS